MMHIAAVIVVLLWMAFSVFALIYARIKLQDLKEKNALLFEGNEKAIEIIESAQKQLLAEKTQRELYQKRSLELEDAIKEGAGVSLRNEITRVECKFNTEEMSTLLTGVRYLIKEYWQSTSAVKFYLALIVKIEENLSMMIREQEDKNKPKE